MKITNPFKRIPRSLKAILCAVCVVVLAIAYYIALGCPTTFRQEFRRAEKANLVGPSKIVDRVSAEEYSEFQTMLVGETDHGILFFGRYGESRSGSKHSGQWGYQFSYQEKTGDISFAVPPIVYRIAGIYDLPVYVFTEHKEAVRASISITVEGIRTYSQNNQTVETPFHEVFQAEAERDKKGFFCFWLSAQFSYSEDDPFDLDNDTAYALSCLSDVRNKTPYDSTKLTMVIPITVTLYDADGNVLVTRELTLGPVQAPAQ